MKTTKQMNSYVLSTVGVVVVIFFFSFTLPQEKKMPEPWPVPEKYKTMENPVEATKESISTGKQLYDRHCASCHGRDGSGGGPKARRLETWEGDLTSTEYQNQTDGELFYKSKFGRDEMPSYEGKIPDVDIWHMVNYMRTMDDNK
ncbi:MAG: c-type cytochrome [Bacteroidota bacterium]